MCGIANEAQSLVYEVTVLFIKIRAALAEESAWKLGSH